jgi:hypothetical protein
MDPSRGRVEDVCRTSALPPAGLPHTLEDLLASLLFASICVTDDVIVVTLSDERRELAELALQLN